MAEELQKFEHCEHIEDVTNFCEECNIFLCEDCSTEHLEHLERLDSWDNEVTKYMSRAKNAQTQVRVLLMRDLNVDVMKKELDKKIDIGFEKIFKKIEDFKAKCKIELWQKFMSETITREIDANREELLKMLKTLGELIDSIQGTSDKETIIMIIGKGILLEIEARIRSNKELKKDIFEHCKHLGDLEVIDEFSFDDLRGFIKFRAPWLKEGEEGPAAPRYCMPNGGKTMKKIGKEVGWESSCCPQPLPKKCRIKFKLTKFSKHTAIIVGVCKRNFVTNNNKVIAFEDNQFGFSEDGAIYYFKGGSKFYHLNGVLEKQGDIMTLELMGNKLYVEHNGKRQPHGFVDIGDGPYHFCTSVFRPEDEVELIEVKEM